MYGKHFASMYSGSMIGAGAMAFSVMGYVIAHQKPDKTVGSQVDINPKLLGAIFGETQEDVEKAVKYLCSPDPDSTTEGDEGRRLVKIGQFSYRVVNGAKYLAIRDEETRRAQNREAQRRKRAKELGAVDDGSNDGNLWNGEAEVKPVPDKPKKASKPTKSEIEEKIEGLKGKVMSTHELADKLGEIHGDEGMGESPEGRRERVLKKIKVAEDIEDEVRRKYNPGYDKTEVREKVVMMPGESVGSYIKRRADEDPITKQDLESVRGIGSDGDEEVL